MSISEVVNTALNQALQAQMLLLRSIRHQRCFVLDLGFILIQIAAVCIKTKSGSIVSRDISTTQIYLHTAKQTGVGIRSPLD